MAQRIDHNQSLPYLQNEPLHEVCCNEIDFICELFEAMDKEGTNGERWKGFWEVARRRDILLSGGTPYPKEFNVTPRRLIDLMHNLKRASELSRMYRSWEKEQGGNTNYQDFKADPKIERQVRKQDEQARKRAAMYGESEYETQHMIGVKGERE